MKFSLLPALGLALGILFSGTAHAQAPAPAPTTLAASDVHSASIHADGTLWTWGANYDGQLGDGSTVGHAQPTQVLLPGYPSGADLANAHWAQVAAGTAHTLALTSTGELYVWGLNADGQLGTGDRRPQHRPVRIAPPTDFPTTRWAQVVAGTSHSLAVTTDGRLFAWGANGLGQLGLGNICCQLRPMPVFLPIGVVGHVAQVAAGNAHSLALTTEGQLFAWGANDCGQLGNGSTASHVLPTAVLPPAGRHAQLWAQVAAGHYHTLALSADGRLFAWGSNKFGQLGTREVAQRNHPEAVAMPTTLHGTTWARVAGGRAHTIALTANGEAYTWGNNYAGQLGTGNTSRHLSPAAIAPTAGCSHRWTQMAAGGFHTLAQSAYGELCTWGSNDFGQLGDGSTTQQARPACREIPAVLLGSTTVVE